MRRTHSEEFFKLTISRCVLILTIKQSLYSTKNTKSLSYYGNMFPSISDRFQANVKGKGKAVPLQSSSGLEGSMKLRFPDYTTTAQGSGEGKRKYPKKIFLSYVCKVLSDNFESS
jgi:hypothetical protein